MRKVWTVCLLLIAVTGFSQQTYPTKLTVAKDGSGDYKTIQEAVNAVRAYSPEPVAVFIKNGVYEEKLVIPSWVTNITITGESRDQTIITNNDYSGKLMARGADTITNKTKFSTFTSYTVWVQGNDVKIENLTIRNTAGRVGQAVALHVDGDRFVIRNCNLLGNQDTLLTAGDSSRQFYVDCYIEGTTDFIFGAATVWFEKCHIHSKKNSHVTAASTPPEKKYGYILNECVLTGDTSLHNVSLGRPWRPYAAVVYMHCFIGQHIKPEGWSNWNQTENYKTTRYAEYKNFGASADPSQRVSWSKQLTDEEAKAITIEKVMAGWKPI